MKTNITPLPPVSFHFLLFRPKYSPNSDACFQLHVFIYGEERWAGHVARIGEERGCIGSWWGNRRERGHWGDLGVDGWILGRISRRWDVGTWTGLGWPRIETGGGRL